MLIAGQKEIFKNHGWVDHSFKMDDIADHLVVFTPTNIALHGSRKLLQQSRSRLKTWQRGSDFSMHPRLHAARAQEKE